MGAGGGSENGSGICGNSITVLTHYSSQVRAVHTGRPSLRLRYVEHYVGWRGKCLRYEHDDQGKNGYDPREYVHW